MIIYCVALMFTIARCADDQHFLTKTVDVGQDVTLKCSRPSSKSGTLFWIKLAAGNLPEVLGATYTFDNGNVNKTPRITTRQEPGTFVLHITKTELSDSAFYYCEKHVELQTTFVNITFLRVQADNTYSWKDYLEVNTILFLLCAVLTISVTVIAVLIGATKMCDCCSDAGKASGDLHNQQADEDMLLYSAVTFTMTKWQ